MAKTVNEIIFDKLIKHQIYLLRLVSGQSENFIAALNKNNPELAAFLHSNISDLNLAQTFNSSMKWKKFENELRQLRAEAIDEITAGYDRESLRIIDNEIKYMKALYDNSIALKEVSTIIPKINTINTLNYGAYAGKTLAKYYEELKYGDTDRIISAVRQGLQDRKAPYQIVNEIIGSKDVQYVDGVTNLTRNNARSIVRTVTQGIVNNAREEYYKANSDIIKQERFTAVLDGRTTLLCMSLDGQLYSLTEGPNPPLHRNCRSLRIAVVDGYALVGDRGYVTDTRTPREMRIDWRADAKNKVGKDAWKELSVKERDKLIAKERTAWQKANIGSAPAKTSGVDWLKTTDKKFQDEYLGKKQAELFRSGELSLDKLIDNSGKRLSVDELYNSYADEFKRAGIAV
jgi:SPP1 gp7 family putative phage head morphogenesis protein